MRKIRICLLPIERVAAVYCALTCVLMVVMMSRLVDPAGMVVMRLEWLAMTLALIGAQHLTAKYIHHSSFFIPPSSIPSPPLGEVGWGPHHSSFFTFLRVLGQVAWLAIWYPDTYEFNRSLNNLDHLFAAAEQSLFGCQPAIEFSQALPGAVWSEAFNLGYWSYFPMIAALLIAIFIKEWRLGDHRVAPRGSETTAPFSFVAATILAAFFLFYVIYIFLPVTGPQFYFQAVGLDEIRQGHFPALGTYFSSHTEMLPSPGWTDGLFSRLVTMAHEAGERPTAAFPSSHIGISTLVILLAHRHVPRLLPFLVPLWLLLCCATVYIQAHYLIDAIAGLLCAPVALWAAERLARKA